MTFDFAHDVSLNVCMMCWENGKLSRNHYEKAFDNRVVFEGMK